MGRSAWPGWQPAPGERVGLMNPECLLGLRTDCAPAPSAGLCASPAAFQTQRVQRGARPGAWGHIQAHVPPALRVLSAWSAAHLRLGLPFSPLALGAALMSGLGRCAHGCEGSSLTPSSSFPQQPPTRPTAGRASCQGPLGPGTEPPKEPEAGGEQGREASFSPPPQTSLLLHFVCLIIRHQHPPCGRAGRRSAPRPPLPAVDVSQQPGERFLHPPLSLRQDGTRARLRPHLCARRKRVKMPARSCPAEKQIA